MCHSLVNSIQPTKTNLDRSKTKIFWIILEKLVSQRFFDRPEDYFSELLYTQSDFPCEGHFLAPEDEKGVKREAPKFATSNKMIPRS